MSRHSLPETSIELQQTQHWLEEKKQSNAGSNKDEGGTSNENANAKEERLLGAGQKKTTTAEVAKLNEVERMNNVRQLEKQDQVDGNSVVRYDRLYNDLSMDRDEIQNSEIGGNAVSVEKNKPHGHRRNDSSYLREEARRKVSFKRTQSTEETLEVLTETRKKSNLKKPTDKRPESTQSYRSSGTSFGADNEMFLRQLLVVKIVFIDIVFSLTDHVSDFLQGLNLILGDYLMSGTDVWNLSNLALYWDTRGVYGMIVLFMNWVPGIVALIHILAHHRGDYAVHSRMHVATEMDYEKKRNESSRRRRKFLCLLWLVVGFYPIVPALTYGLLLWRWNWENFATDTFARTEQYAMVAHCITGGFEAPIQLSLTVWLILKGVIESPVHGSFSLELPKDRFGNPVPWPAIPMISMFFSLGSIIIAATRLNIPLPFAYQNRSLKQKFSKKITLMLGQLPFFISSALFRVFGFGFIGIYLDLYIFGPLLAIFLVNLISGYVLQKEFNVKRNRGLYRKLKKMEGPPPKIEIAIWLNSFIGLFVPCCYTEVLERQILKQFDEGDLNKLDEIREKGHQRVLKHQSVWGTIIIIICVLACWLLVNFNPGFGYHENSLNNGSFNLFCGVLLCMGLICLIVTCFHFDVLKMVGIGSKKVKPVAQITIHNRDDPPARPVVKKRASFIKRIIVCVAMIFVMTSPLSIGGLVQEILIGKDYQFAVIHPRIGPNDHVMDLLILKLYKLYEPRRYDPNMMRGTLMNFNPPSDWRPVRNPTILLMDLDDHHSVNALKSLHSVTFNNTNIRGLVLIESWQNRSSSPFPAQIYEDYGEKKNPVQTKELLSIAFPFPVYTLRKKDKIAVLRENNINVTFFFKKEIQIVVNSLESILTDDSSLDIVSCPQSDRPYVNLLGTGGVFLDEENNVKRMVNQSVSCYDKGLKCAEMERFQRNNRQQVNRKKPMKCINQNLKWENISKTDLGDHFYKEETKLEEIKCCTENRTTIYYPSACTTNNLRTCLERKTKWIHEIMTCQISGQEYRTWRYCRLSSTCGVLEQKYAWCPHVLQNGREPSYDQSHLCDRSSVRAHSVTCSRMR